MGCNAIIYLTAIADAAAFAATRDAAIEELKAAGMTEVCDWFFAQYNAALELYK